MRLPVLITLAVIGLCSHAHAQAAPQYNQPIVRQPMYTAPGMPPLNVPATQNPYAAAQQVYQQPPAPVKVQQCIAVPNGNGGFIQRCF
jgi:hypothetical protein